MSDLQGLMSLLIFNLMLKREVRNMAKKALAVISMSIIAFFVLSITFSMLTNAETIRDRKYVENQTSASYNDGKYKGTLERYGMSTLNWTNF